MGILEGTFWVDDRAELLLLWQGELWEVVRVAVEGEARVASRMEYSSHLSVWSFVDVFGLLRFFVVCCVRVEILPFG